MKIEYTPIGTLRSCFREKFGVPRQSGMVSEARGYVKLDPDPRFARAFERLEEFSHLWLVFAFHRKGERIWRPTIEPPRVSVPRVGVFASRSPHRPNPIGISVVKLERIDFEAPGGIELHVSGLDILDGSPILDVKPYLPYADAIPGANAGWAADEINRYSVQFSAESEAFLADLSGKGYSRVKELIEEMMAWDPRPTSQRRQVPMNDPQSFGRRFAFRLLDFDIHWEIRATGAYVVKVVGLTRASGTENDIVVPTPV